MGNIDGQHLRPPVLAILLKGKILTDCKIHQYFHQNFMLYGITNEGDCSERTKWPLSIIWGISLHNIA